jgi:hypothetical protein
MTLIHVSLEPCIACVQHLRVIDVGTCLLCVEVMHHSAIHLTVLVKARENSQLRLQHACVPRLRAARSNIFSARSNSPSSDVQQHGSLRK